MLSIKKSKFKIGNIVYFVTYGFDDYGKVIAKQRLGKIIKIRLLPSYSFSYYVETYIYKLWIVEKDLIRATKNEEFMFKLENE